MSGPAGTGKSRAALEKLNALALMHPGMRGLIVRKTATSLTSTALATWKRDVVPELTAKGAVSFYGGSAEEPAQYRYANGSKVLLGGMDKPTKIMSSEYDVVYVQEAIELSENDWESITTRLRSNVVSFQQIIADTNPDAPTHWLKQRCDRRQTTVLESRHEDNPTIMDPVTGELTERGRDYIAKLDALTGVRHKRLRLGLWVAAEGQIYDEWDPAIHVVEPFVIPSSWDRWWSVDFGYTNPFVLQCWAEDPDGRLFLYRELYRTQRLVEDHARDILGVVAPGGVWSEPRPRGVICDHDAEDRATLERHLGLSTQAAHKAVTTGIEAVKSRLKAAGDGRPRLFVMRDAVVERDSELTDSKRPTSTEEEVPGYVWDRRDGKPPKEAPVKDDDHGMDALRYVVATRDLAPKGQFRGWL